MSTLYYDAVVKKGFHINKALDKSEHNKYKLNGRKHSCIHRSNTKNRLSY